MLIVKCNNLATAAIAVLLLLSFDRTRDHNRLCVIGKIHNAFHFISGAESRVKSITKTSELIVLQSANIDHSHENDQIINDIFKAAACNNLLFETVEIKHMQIMVNFMASKICV